MKAIEHIQSFFNLVSIWFKGVPSWLKIVIIVRLSASVTIRSSSTISWFLTRGVSAKFAYLTNWFTTLFEVKCFTIFGTARSMHTWTMTSWSYRRFLLIRIVYRSYTFLSLIGIEIILRFSWVLLTFVFALLRVRACFFNTNRVLNNFLQGSLILNNIIALFHKNVFFNKL